MRVLCNSPLHIAVLNLAICWNICVSWATIPIMESENASSADNQQERFQGLASIGYYLSGFVEGEGSFNVSFRKKSDYKVGWQVVLSFNVSQKDITVLRILKDKLSCGIIKQRKRDGLFSYDVTNSVAILNQVIPFFEKYPLLSKSKRDNFLIFKKISNKVGFKDHLTEEGLIEIAKLRESLNKGKGRTRKYTLNDILGKSSETTRQTPIRIN